MPFIHQTKTIMPNNHQTIAVIQASTNGRKKRRGQIEKKRRDKINCSLTKLKSLVPAAREKQAATKLEKAEILQLTVEFLEDIKAKGYDKLIYAEQTSRKSIMDSDQLSRETTDCHTFQHATNNDWQVAAAAATNLNLVQTQAKTCQPSTLTNSVPNTTVTTNSQLIHSQQDQHPSHHHQLMYSHNPYSHHYDQHNGHQANPYAHHLSQNRAVVQDPSSASCPYNAAYYCLQNQ